MRTYNKKVLAFNSEQFLHNLTPESSYIFGLLWADGNLGNDKNCEIVVEMVKSDLELLKPIFDKTGIWRSYFRERQNWKPQMTLKINNRPLYEFLVNCGYKSKSGVSACKILQHIPTHYHKFFFRGLSDGDGCFYINNKNYVRHFICGSTSDQDWTYFENMLKGFGIAYSISRRSYVTKSGKTQKSSVLRITSKNAIIRFGDFIYEGYPNDLTGLPRKYAKFLEISIG